jgi:hypothetical protein
MPVPGFGPALTGITVVAGGDGGGCSITIADRRSVDLGVRVP